MRRGGEGAVSILLETLSLHLVKPVPPGWAGGMFWCSVGCSCGFCLCLCLTLFMNASFKFLTVLVL